jgi:uncharacterized protein (DUF2062 family)
MSDPQQAGTAPKLPLWRRWIVEPVRIQLTQGVTPQKVSLSIAIGSALALFPILGTTTGLGILAGVVLRLNQPVLQAINALCYPIYLPLIVVFIRLGEKVSGAPASGIDFTAMLSTFSHHPGDFFREFGATALHAVLGWAVVAPIWIPVVYLSLIRPMRWAAGRVGRVERKPAG